MGNITLEDPAVEAQAERLASGSKGDHRAFAEMRRLAARGKIASAMPIAGGANNPAHPFAPPTVSGTTMTVEQYLNAPTRITRMIMDLSLQRFIADRVFASAGGVTGGAVVYDQATLNELYASRDVERVEPGTEYPLVTSEILTPKVAEVEKWGGKVFITDEAKDRNQTTTFANKIRQLTNTQIRKINQRAMEVLAASITEFSQTFTGVDWGDVVVGGSGQSNADEFPLRDFATAAQLAEEDELGVVYDLVILNPQEYTQLVIIYGASGLRDLLSELGFELYVSNRQAAGKAKFVASQQVGEMRVEKPLGSVTWYEEATERTWVQSSVRPVMYVTNPYGVLETTGLAG